MVVNNRKWTYSSVKLLVEQRGYELIDFIEQSIENGFKAKIIISNGFEEKLMSVDNFVRNRFGFKPNTPDVVKSKIEKFYNIKLDYIECIKQSNKNHEDVYKLTYHKKTIVRTLDSLYSPMRNNNNIFTNKRLRKWTKEEIEYFLKSSGYDFKNIKIEFNGNKKNCYIKFTFDKLEHRVQFTTLKSRIIFNDESYYKLNIGATYYKEMLKKKFNITNIDFIRIYKFTTKTGKKTYACDIVNTDNGMKRYGVLLDNIKKRGCTFNSSLGETIVRNLLNKYKISFLEQQRFDDCKNISKLIFDFYLPTHNIAIEYDGVQHYMPIDAFGGEKAYKETLLRDNIKDKYCCDNNIKLIRIPYYTTIEDIEKTIKDIVSTNQK